MIWIIAAVGLALVMLILMSKRAEEDDDPVWQTVVAVDHLADEIARWETNLWSLWAMAVIENLLFRLDKPEQMPYLHKLEDQIIELQQKLYKEQPMSEKGPVFPYFDEKTTGLQAH